MPDGDAPEWVLGGRYRILERLGTGGMAEVFRAHDETLDRDVAVKVFRSVVEDPDDPAGEERRELELHALARLNHPHLVTLYDGSVAQNPGYLVLELVDGPTLAQRLREGPLTEAAAAQLGAQIADALAYVHANDMVHRDVKPANILLGNDGGPGPDGMRARLSDFGIVRLVGSNRMTAVGRTMGTATYLAPEQARGMDVGAPADVYSLGLVLIEALTGVPSFDGPMEEVLAARLSRPPDVPATLPQPWPGLLTAMTATDPAARPDAATVAATLRGTASFAAIAALPTAAVPAVAGLAAAPDAFGGAVAGAATGPVTGLTGPSAAAPVLTPLPVGDQRRGAHREQRSGMGWLLGAAALAAIVVGGLIVLLSVNGGGSPSNTPGPTSSNQRVQGPGGSSLAAKNKSSSHSAPPSHSASNSASHSSAPSSAPQTSTSTSPPPSSAPQTTHSTTTHSTSRPPSSSTSAVSTSASATKASTSPAAKTTSPAASSSTSIRPAGATVTGG